MGPLRFELRSIAPEATRIPSYPTGPGVQNKNRNYVEDIFGYFKRDYFRSLRSLPNSAYFFSIIFADSKIASLALKEPSVS